MQRDLGYALLNPAKNHPILKIEAIRLVPFSATGFAQWRENGRAPPAVSWSMIRMILVHDTMLRITVITPIVSDRTALRLYFIGP